MKVQIAPSLLACDFGKLAEEVKAVEAAGADLLHLDIMDGHFVPNITFGPPIVQRIRAVTQLTLDAHLMISNPESYIDAFHKAGCDWISVHVEACTHLHRTIKQIQSLGIKAGVAINPGTALSQLDAVLSEVDYVLLMSVNPGFGGQTFISETLERTKTLRTKLGSRDIRIQVDGGLKEKNIGEIVAAGADVLVVGTGLFEADDYNRRMQALRQATGV